MGRPAAASPSLRVAAAWGFALQRTTGDGMLEHERLLVGRRSLPPGGSRLGGQESL
ncbi:hypothetical protein [Quadrisphaera sp. INWT6]|uniref:hypothetical protein n=1 Tax=Quadrisphaera sp. INWT6 TaxID=2596917 RepID=UPI00189259E8|nr:hypothetical protein [Quadrisphaera sp. INWT6]